MENFLWMVAGAVISAWTGVVTSRYYLFHQEIQRAREKATTIVDRFSEMLKAPDANQAETFTTWIMFEPAMALQFQGHFDAASAIKGFDFDLADAGMTLWRRFQREKTLAAGSTADIDAAIGHVLTDVQQLLFEIVEELGKLWPYIPTVLFGEFIGKKIRGWSGHGQRLYVEFTEHLETGASLEEIRERRKRRREQKK